MPIEIKVYTVLDNGDEREQIDRSMAALGFHRETSAVTHEALDKLITFAAGAKPTVGPSAEAEEGEQPEAPVARERGKPAPGKARRTKEEIAEDEAADAAGAATTSKAEAVANISTGEERVDPAGVAAQDKADEQAEVEANRDADKPVTVDDVKAVVNQYVTKFGLPATQEDGPKIFVEALGTPPEGESYWKMSILPADQESLKKVLSVWQRAVVENPLKRQAV